MPGEVADCSARGASLKVNFDRIGLVAQTGSAGTRLPGATQGGLLCEYLNDGDGTSLQLYFQDDGTVHEAHDGVVAGIYQSG